MHMHYDNFSIAILDYCNLNCAGCNHFSPLVKEKKFIQLSFLESILQKLYSIKPHSIINIVGGEPLLHPYIKEIALLCKKYFIDTYIVTNGLLLTNYLKQFFDNNSIKLLINKYGKIRTTFCTQYLSDNWINQKNIYCLPKTNNAENCLYVTMTGLLYRCAIPANIESYNRYYNKNLKTIENDDYINIFNASKSDILKFILLKKSSNFCGYCREPKISKWHLFNGKDEWSLLTTF